MDKLADDLDIALLPSGQGVIIDPATLLGGMQSDDDEGSAPPTAAAAN